MNPVSYPTALSRSTGCENRTHGLLVPNQVLYQTEPIRYMQQTRCRNIAGDGPARKTNVVIIRDGLVSQATPPGLEPGISAVTGLRNNQLSYEAIIYTGLRSSIYPQIYTRILFATKRKPNGQGEIRTHNVSSVTVLQTACFSHFAYLP